MSELVTVSQEHGCDSVVQDDRCGCSMDLPVLGGGRKPSGRTLGWNRRREPRRGGERGAGTPNTAREPTPVLLHYRSLLHTSLH